MHGLNFKFRTKVKVTKVLNNVLRLFFPRGGTGHP